MMWLPNVLLTSRSTCVMSLEETRASSFISCGKTGEEEQASGTDPDLSRAAMLGREPCGHHGSVSCQNLFPSSGKPGMGGVPPCPWDLCEGLCPVVVGGEVTECQPGWEGIGVQPRWEGTWECCAQGCESEKPLSI